MLSFEQLSLIKKVPTLTKNRRNLFYFPKLTEPTTHLIETLFFRLENVAEQSMIILGDTRIVKPIDIKTGLFIPSDLGKSRSSVIARRFTGLGKTQFVSLSQNAVETYRLVNQDTNLFIMSYGDVEPEDYNNIKHLMQSKEDENKSPLKTYLFRLGIDGSNISVRLTELSATRTLGDTEPLETSRNSTNIQSKFVRFSLASQLLFNMLNNLLTSETNFNYVGVDFDKDEFKTSITHLFGLPDDSVFSQIEGTSLGLDIFTLNKIQKKLSKFKKANELKHSRYLSLVIDGLEENSSHIYQHIKFTHESLSNIRKAYKKVEDGSHTLEGVQDIWKQNGNFLGNGITTYEQNKEEFGNLISYLADVISSNVHTHTNNINVISSLYILNEFVMNTYVDRVLN